MTSIPSEGSTQETGDSDENSLEQLVDGCTSRSDYITLEQERQKEAFKTFGFTDINHFKWHPYSDLI